MQEIEIRTDKNAFLLGKLVKVSDKLSIEYRYKGNIDYITWDHLVKIVEEYKIMNKETA